MKRVLGGTAVVLAVVWAAPAGAREVDVAVAANFVGPMERIEQEFVKDTGQHVHVTSGATGKLYAQIKAGAPFDVLLSADDETTRKLEAEKLAVDRSHFVYAIGTLVLWSAKPGYVDASGAVLKTGTYAHLAVANPKLAPYGAAAVATLNALGIFASVQPKLVYGENIGQTAQFVSTGNAELGFVALSQVAVPGKPQTGSYWKVPPNLYPAIRQEVVLLNHGTTNPISYLFLQYLRADKARAIVKEFGYGLDEAAADVRTPAH